MLLRAGLQQPWPATLAQMLYGESRPLLDAFLSIARSLSDTDAEVLVVGFIVAVIKTGIVAGIVAGIAA